MTIQFIFSFVITLTLATGCKKGGVIPPANTPQTSISSDLSGRVWLSQNDWNISTDPAYYTLTVYNSASKKWFNNQRDPWDMQPRPANGVLFTGDGEFEICKFSDFGTGGLRSYTFFYMQGSAEQDGKVITIHPATHQTTYYSTSDPGLNYDKSLDRSSSTFTYHISAAGNGWNELSIEWSDKTYSYFYSRE